jgi:2'-5' RNA ligase
MTGARPMADLGGLTYPAPVELLAVICPLDIATDDRAWIEGIRARHDPQHDLVEAHFTLVFPMAEFSTSILARHIEQIAECTPAIAFRLNCARAVRDRLAPRSHVFLTPDEGDAEIRMLHGALYSGELSPSLRTDIPYQPHVTVAALETQSAAKTLSDEIGEFEISGSLRSLALMSVNEGAIRQQRLFPLL